MSSWLHCKGLDDEAAALVLAVWARRNQGDIMFAVRRVREHGGLFVLMSDKRQCSLRGNGYFAARYSSAPLACRHSHCQRRFKFDPLFV
jgi:hypothetical protein